MSVMRPSLNKDWKAALSSHSISSTLRLHERFEDYFRQKENIVRNLMKFTLINELTSIVVQYCVRSVNYENATSIEPGDLLLVRQLFNGFMIPAIVLNVFDSKLFVHYLNPRMQDELIDVPHVLQKGLQPISKLDCISNYIEEQI